MLRRIRHRHPISIVTPTHRLAIYHWRVHYCVRISMAGMLEKEGDIYDHRCKKSTKMPKRYRKIAIWHQIAYIRKRL